MLAKSFLHHITYLMIFLGVFIFSRPASGHQKGAPFSGAIPEPIKVHHAHIEDEQRVNLTLFDDLHVEEKDPRTAFSSSLELAAAWGEDFRFGSELNIPFSNTGLSEDQYGIGDIEIWPVKYAFINEPERILTGSLSIGLPTGSEPRGLGEDQTTLGGLLFFDQAYRNWYLGINAEWISSVSGSTSSEFEAALALSYSFIEETGDGMAPSRPQQSFVPSLSLELISESVLSGTEEGDNVITLLPGFHLWHPDSGWQARVGVEFPLSSDRENDFAFHLQIGNHFDWNRLFNSTRKGSQP